MSKPFSARNQVTGVIYRVLQFEAHHWGKGVILKQSCAFWCLIICSLENWEIPSTSGDIREKPKIYYFVFLTLFQHMNKIAFADIYCDVSFLKNHHQLSFFKYGPVLFILISFYISNSVIYKSCFRYAL